MENYEFHPWEICDGVRPNIEGSESVQRMFYHQNFKQAVCNPTIMGCEMPNQLDWLNTFAFRRVKKPEVQTCFGFFDKGEAMWYWGGKDCGLDTHRLTFNVDSEGNPYNFKCERTK